MDQKIIDRIGKLLARADEARNDNEHERAIAMRQAHAMLAMHGLSLADVTEAAMTKENFGILGRTEVECMTRYRWESGVWGQVAKLNTCAIVGSGTKKIWLIGRQLRCEVVKSMSHWLV
jgi:hypothetical protein